jgi:SAM-dependent methyltransferase
MLSEKTQGEGGGVKSSAFDYWRSGRGLGNITPAGKQWPEGEGFPIFLSNEFRDLRVVEFGCGVGRLAGCFDPEMYVGVDICPDAIAIARRDNPKHVFKLLDGGLPAGDVLLCHTVLLHVPDDELPATLEQFHHETVVVSEVMGRAWRRDGLPPVYNREQGDYRAAFLAAGYELDDVILRPYEHYRNTNLTVLFFGRRA